LIVSFFLFSRTKKLLSSTDTTTAISKSPRKGKKCHAKEENTQAVEINSLPIQSRRETRNSAKAAALLKQKENSDEITEDNKRKFMYVYLVMTHYTEYT